MSKKPSNAAVPLKRQCHEIFCFWFFLWISFPQAPEYTIRAVSNFFENSWRYSQLKVDQRYQRHRWQICHRCQRHRRQNCRRYQRHRRQILPPVSLVLLIPVANLPPVSTILAANLPPMSTTPALKWNLKVNLKAKTYIFVNSTVQRCPNKIFKIFLIKDFFICHRHRWSTLSCEYLREFSKKLETVLMGYSGAGGKLIHEKN